MYINSVVYNYEGASGTQLCCNEMVITNFYVIKNLERASGYSYDVTKWQLQKLCM
jgi:hypothetical protein